MRVESKLEISAPPAVDNAMILARPESFGAVFALRKSTKR